MFSATLLPSCQAELGPDTQADELPVTVSMSLTVAPMAAGTEEGLATRTVDDPANPADITIRNLCILQYAGTTEDAPLVGRVHYLSDEDDGDAPLDMSRIPLTASGGAVHTLVILANTFTRITPSETLGEMVTRTRVIFSASDVTGHDSNASFDTDRTDSYQRLGGLAVTPVREGASILITLKRTMARLNVRITNAGFDDNLVIQEVQLCNVARKELYLADYSYTDPSDGETKQLFPAPAPTPFNRAEPVLMNFPVQSWTGAADGTGTATYQWYVPENQRGNDCSCLNPDDKNNSPYSFGATYVLVKGVYGDTGIPLEYRFFLGANLKDDFNILPNTAYSYDLRFEGKGKAGDRRINEWADVDFDVDANCYILNPSPYGDRTFTFNAIHRPNLFWGDRYDLHEQYPNYLIDRTKTWHTILLWSDFEMTQAEADAFLVTKEGNGDGDYDSPSQRIKVVVPAGHAPGNAIVGIYIDDPSNIIWSWQLWITDYRPDDIGNRPPNPERHLYPVTGGEVHRYEGAAWNAGGRYENGYAMDRNLGAKTIRTGAGVGCYYQWGRKDPFPGKYDIWVFDADNVPTRKVASKDRTPKVSHGYSGYVGVVPERVNHPMSFIVVYNNGDDPFYQSSLWHDPKTTTKTAHEESGKNADKSFFDPCPPGWKIPYGNCYTFRGGTNSSYSSTTSETDNFIKYAEDSNGYYRGSGRTYYPGGFLANKDNPDAETVFFPYNDVWNSTTIMSYGEYSRGLYWCFEGIEMLQLDYYSTGVTVQWWGWEEQPAGIRCVKE